MAIEIFISHSSQDRRLVRLFTEALQASLVIPEDGVRCSSLPGYRLRAGVHTSTTLRSEVSQASVIIGILTPDSLESGWVMFELGAGWGAQKLVMPVIAGIDYETVPGPLKENNLTDGGSRAELEQLFEDISQALGYERRRAGRATEAIDELVEEAESYFEDDEDEDEEGDGDDDEDDEDR